MGTLIDINRREGVVASKWEVKVVESVAEFVVQILRIQIIPNPHCKFKEHRIYPQTLGYDVHLVKLYLLEEYLYK